MIKFIERNPFKIQLLTLAGIVFLFGINFIKIAIPMAIAFALALPLSLLSVFCFFVVCYHLVSTWKHVADGYRLLNLVKVFISFYSVFMNVCCAAAFFMSSLHA